MSHGLHRKSTIRTLLHDYQEAEEKLEHLDTREFNLFTFASDIGREKTFQILSIHLYMTHKLDIYINEKKFAIFLGEVYKKYNRAVQYHNDLHGIDVCHMANLLLRQGNLIQLAELNHIDVIAFLTAGMCHDLGHDGFTNQYHINAVTDRAVLYNDISVQENYHVAQA